MNNFNFMNGWKTWQVFAAMCVAGFIWSYINYILGTILWVVIALAANQWYNTKGYHTGFDGFVRVVAILNAVICGIYLVF